MSPINSKKSDLVIDFLLFKQSEDSIKIFNQYCCRALRLAYSSKNFNEINRLVSLLDSTNSKLLVDWFMFLGIVFKTPSYEAIRIGNASFQSRAFNLAVATPIKFIIKPIKKYDACAIKVLHEYCLTALKYAYTNNNLNKFDKVNFLLEKIKPDLLFYITLWFMKLGIVYETPTSKFFKVANIKDKKLQCFVFEKAKYLSLDIPLKSVKSLNPSTAWFDDTEKSVSIRAFQGGRASGK